MDSLPTISISPEAQKHILKRNSSATIVRSPKAGRYGYPADALQISCEKPEDVSSYILVHADGIDFYLSTRLTLENYEQINVWLKVHYGLFRDLRTRVTLYRRLTP